MGDSIACPASSSTDAPADADERDAEGELEHMEPEVLKEFSFENHNACFFEIESPGSPPLDHIVCRSTVSLEDGTVLEDMVR
eukprot:1540172-Amphidinium_carterae.1